MQTSKAIGRTAIQQLSRRSAHHATPVQSTFNDLPQPHGNWKTHHDARNRKYTAHLLIGTGALAGTILFGFTSGLFEAHNDIPKRPAPPQNYK